LSPRLRCTPQIPAHGFPSEFANPRILEQISTTGGLRDKSELHERVVITPLNLSNQLATLFARRELKSLKLLVCTTEIPLNDLQSSIDLIKPLLSIGDLPSFDGQRS
jgi:hypothetical protein